VKISQPFDLESGVVDLAGFELPVLAVIGVFFW
jgi:hypothetical protein